MSLAEYCYLSGGISDAQGSVFLGKIALKCFYGQPAKMSVTTYGVDVE